MLTYPICDSIHEWAQTYPGAESIEIIPPCELDRRLPNTLEPTLHPLFPSALHKDVPAKYLARLPEVKVFGRDGLLILPSGCFALEWAFLPEIFNAHPDATRVPTEPVERKSGVYYSLLRVHWYNYSHWLHDCLMRLYGVLDRLPPETLFIVPATLAPNWQAALQALGIPPERQIPFSGETTWQLETLYFTSHTRRASFDLPAEVEWFRARMWRACGVTQPARRKRIYISRRTAGWRRIVNDAEVEQCLRRYGFESYTLQDLPFCEQVKLFSQAEIVVACHGAGITNILFAPPHATLVEMFSPNFVKNDFWAMCNAAQVKYWYMVVEQMPGAPAPLADLRVPIAKLEQLITAVLAKTDS